MYGGSVASPARETWIYRINARIGADFSRIEIANRHEIVANSLILQSAGGSRLTGLSRPGPRNAIVDFDDYSLIDQAFNTQDAAL